MVNPLFPDYSVDYDFTSTSNLYCNATWQSTEDGLFGVGGGYGIGLYQLDLSCKLILQKYLRTPLLIDVLIENIFQW